MKKIIKKLAIILMIALPPVTFLEANENILSIGSKNAKVTVRVFSSLTCPHCANFHDKIFENLKKEYIDEKKIKFEHHSFPLDLAALNAEKVIRSIENKEKSFEFLKVIYEKQDQWAIGTDINKINNYIKKIGKEFGLNDERMDKFINDEKIQDQILNERINAQKNYNISSTPTIYINEKKYEGEHNFKAFKKVLDKII